MNREVTERITFGYLTGNPSMPGQFFRVEHACEGWKTDMIHEELTRESYDSGRKAALQALARRFPDSEFTIISQP